MAYWSSERDDELLRLRAQKYSAASIAAFLGDGLSRNAVIGRLHRLGIKEGKVVKKRVLRERKKPMLKTAQTPHSSAPRLVRDNDAFSPPRKPKSRIVCTEADSSLASAPLNITLMELNARTCCWPVNEPEPKEEYLFCGHPKKYGSYCAHHAAMSVGQGTFAEAIAHKLGWAA